MGYVAVAHRQRRWQLTATTIGFRWWWGLQLRNLLRDPTKMHDGGFRRGFNVRGRSIE